MESGSRCFGPTMLSQLDLEGLIGPILLQSYPGRTLNSMSVQELRESLKGVPGADSLTVSYAHNGNQVLHIGDKAVEVGPMASNEEIRAALQNPFVATKNTTVKMAKSPLQGLGQKLGLTVHNAQLDAAAISKKIDELEARRQAAVPKVMAGLDAQGADIGDLETFVSDLEKATNG